ncbi:hypothetical protein OUW_11879 [Mycobacteroides abscessus M93]|nr:hypothetical protein OUW_11879 [Mycobacteroides abscessus M93]
MASPEVVGKATPMLPVCEPPGPAWPHPPATNMAAVHALAMPTEGLIRPGCFGTPRRVKDARSHRLASAAN